ncbi:HAD family hydrolase [Actibacterium lipolyticum]|uniref:HAD family hydrolase n=1 Tax=Actibacterium lipolyticum TaxID=1524263 RepID=UPI001F408B90|nr:HAD family hydrolase [Actibacterium lipolyticum]
MIIFDCDGVLVDSEPISVAVLVEVLAEAGCDLPLDQAYGKFLGRSMATIGKLLKDEFGLSITSEHLSEIRRRLYERFRGELRPIPGLADVVHMMDRPVCVASSSQPERIRLSLEVTGLLQLFEPHIFSATMVEKGKPEPDLFLYAAQKMGVDPRHCTVIEDSAAGIRAAKAANMRVIAFTGGSHAGPADLDGTARALSPDAIIGDMRNLPEVLGKIG